MPAIPNCFRRGPAYYWRRWTPEPDRYLVQIALGVKDQGTARRLSSRLTAQSDVLFAAWGTRAMNREELQTYLSHCLDRYGSSYYAIEGGARWQENYWRHIALGHAHLLVAKRGIGASLLKREAEAINREWESEALANRVQEAISYVVEQQYSIEGYIASGVEAATLSDREPTEADAEQAVACQMLAKAAGHFRKAKSYGVDEARIDHLIGQCTELSSIPVPQGRHDPLRDAIVGALSYLREQAYFDHGEGSDPASGLALFADLTFPPSAWAENLYARVKRDYADDGAGQVLERLTAALHDLPLQIQEAHSLRRQRLHSLLHEPDRVADPLYASPAEEWSASVQHQREHQREALFAPVAQGRAFHQDAPATVATAVGATSKTFIAMGEMLATNKLQDQSWDIKTARQARSLYALFSKFLAEEHGVTTFVELRQSHLYAYDQFMRALHTSYGRSPSDLNRSIAQLREISRHKPLDQQGLAVPTRNRHLTQLGTLLDEAESQGEKLDPGLNLTRLRGKKQGRSRDDRLKPSESQVDSFFRSPIFMGCSGWRKPHQPGDQVFHRGAYFGPLLAYYQGMRREEYCGLGVSEIITDNDSHPYLHIVPNEFRRLKNPQSRRSLALHPELIRLGFLDYVEALKKVGQDRVFPDLYSPGTSSLLGDRLYKELESLRKALNITPHQFRHLFNDGLKQKGVAEEFRADLMGHVGDSETTERYCNPLKLEAQMQELLKLPVCTAHIERKPIQLIPWVSQRQIAPWSRAAKKS
jgi:integrase